MSEKKSLRMAGALVTAYGISCLYPKWKLLSIEEAEIGFVLKYAGVSEVKDEFVEQIEEQIRSISADDIPIDQLTMIADNAADLLRDQGQKELAKQVAERSGEEVSVCRLKHFVVPCETSISSTKPSAATEVLSWTIEKSKSTNYLVLEGTTLSNKKELKEFRKAYHASAKNHHLKLASELELYIVDELGQIQWLPRGLKVKEALIAHWKSAFPNTDWVETRELVPYLFSENEDSLRSDLTSSHAWLAHHTIESVKKGVIFGEVGTVYREQPMIHAQRTHFCPREQGEAHLNSSLQLIFEWSKLFDLNGEWVLSEPLLKDGSKGEGKESFTKILRNSLEGQSFEWITKPGKAAILEWIYTDLLGRETSIVRIEQETKLKNRVFGKESNSFLMIRESFFEKLERFIALLLEKTGGELPF